MVINFTQLTISIVPQRWISCRLFGAEKSAECQSPKVRAVYPRALEPEKSTANFTNLH